jgi:hypothetical protein
MMLREGVPLLDDGNRTLQYPDWHWEGCYNEKKRVLALIKEEEPELNVVG